MLSEALKRDLLRTFATNALTSLMLRRGAGWIVWKIVKSLSLKSPRLNQIL
jgi:hypothetical protein